MKTLFDRKTVIKQERKHRKIWLSLPPVLSIAALVVAGAGFVLGLDHEKIGVVRTADLVAKYRGMEDARTLFEGRRQGWQGEIDTLEADYRKSVGELNAQWNQLTPVERTKREELIAAQGQNVARYGQSLEAKVRAEEEELMQGVLSQVNEAIREYAEANGYDAIYGATPDGSILYGSDALDITDELIEVLNRNYSGFEESRTENSVGNDDATKSHEKSEG